MSYTRSVYDWMGDAVEGINFSNLLYVYRRARQEKVTLFGYSLCAILQVVFEKVVNLSPPTLETFIGVFGFFFLHHNSSDTRVD